jgi:hypothetical protein
MRQTKIIIIRGKKQLLLGFLYFYSNDLSKKDFTLSKGRSILIYLRNVLIVPVNGWKKLTAVCY